MSRTRFSRSAARALLALHLSLCPFAVALTSASEARAKAPPGREISLFVDGTPWDLEPEAVRAAIGRELGAPVVLSSAPPAGKAALVLRGESGRRVTLTYRSPGGDKQIERTIDLPDDADEAAEAIALLAVNLSQDEAAELAALFGKRPDEEKPQAAENAPPNPEPPAPIEAKKEEPKPPVEETRPPPPPKKPEPSPASAAQKPRFCALAKTSRVFLGADVVPRVGTSTTTGTNTVRNVSASLLVGYGAGLAGIEIGAGLNIESGFACGVQFGAGANLVNGEVRGAQVAGGFNFARAVYGAQLGPVNMVAGPLFGLQAGAVEIAGSVKGVQLGAVEIAGSVKGVQLGAVEIAGSVEGVQIGAVNIASGRVKGAQIGVVNYADRSSFSFGLVNIIRHGRTHVDVWGQETGLVMAGIEHGSDHFHNIYGIGVRPVGASTRASFALGVGGHLRLSKRLALDLDVLSYSLHDTSTFEPTAFLAQARALFAFELGARLGVVVGPSYSVVSANSAEEAQLAPYVTSSFDQQGTNRVLGWPGLTAGIRTF